MSVSTPEDELVQRLTRIFGAGPTGEVELGLGDDCAVLAGSGKASGEKLVWTVDAQVDAVHFRREWLTYEEIGFRAFAAAASDVVAMAATPIAALSALTLDPRISPEDVEALARGQRAASQAASAPVVGGNLSRGATFSVTTTVLGRVARAITRVGARPGERVWVGGPLGLARLGLLAHQRGVADDPALRAGVEAFARPHVRYDLVPALRMASAAIDISDGLSLDLARLAAQSGVRVVLAAEQVLACGGPALARVAARLQEDPLACALLGGEDYVVVACAAGDLPGFVPIGAVEEGAGVALIEAGRTRELRPAGHDHLVVTG